MRTFDLPEWGFQAACDNHIFAWQPQQSANHLINITFAFQCANVDESFWIFDFFDMIYHSMEQRYDL